MHEIKQNDGLVLAVEKAWHGLGVVVESAPNPFAALRLAGLEWTVEESVGVNGVFNAGTPDEYRVSTDDAKILVRSDDRTVLGVVGPDYRPVQNAHLAEMAFNLRNNSDGTALVESAGSIRGGKRVWMLLKGESVDMTGFGDEARPYLFIATSHDGTLPLTLMPNSIRVVCANTFNAALGCSEKRLTFRHTKGITARVEEMKEILARWRANIDAGREVATTLANRPMTREEIQSLWTEVFVALDGPIPSNPANGHEQNRRDRAVEAFAHMTRVFDTEAPSHGGANLWVAANAATNWVQHLKAQRSVRSSEDRPFAAWAGRTAAETAEVFDLALATV